MDKITINEATTLLLQACPGLYADLAASLAETPGSRAWLSHGAVILKTLIHYSETEIRPIWYLCDTGDCNLAMANADLGHKKRKALYRVGKREGDYSLIFSRVGEACEDPAVRQLTIHDREQAMAALAVPEDDSKYAKIIAGVIKDGFDTAMQVPERHRILGIFDGAALAGLLKLDVRSGGEVICVADVFVAREYRGRGFAPRLIRAATAMYPGARYHYSCGAENTASAAAAKSAGFELAGICTFGESSVKELCGPVIDIKQLRFWQWRPWLLRDFDRTQHVERIWRQKNGAWRLMGENFVQDWSKEKKRRIPRGWKRDLRRGAGVIYIAREGRRLAGFVEIGTGRVGSAGQGVQLKYIMCSRAYRGIGLGGRLFTLACDEARQLGASTLYVSAFPAEDTISFYRHMGCADAGEVIPALVAAEPLDMQLEYRL